MCRRQHDNPHAHHFPNERDGHAESRKIFFCFSRDMLAFVSGANGIALIKKVGHPKWGEAKDLPDLVKTRPQLPEHRESKLVQCLQADE